MSSFFGRENLRCEIDEQIVYNQLDNNEAAIWSLLLAGGYLKIIDYDEPDKIEQGAKAYYEAALNQIEEKCYAASLLAKGIPAEKIYKYGFAFEGKTVLIDTLS